MKGSFPPDRSDRGGFTLVELLTVISVMTVLMAAGTRLAILLLSLNTAAAADLAQRDTVGRFEIGLRRDLRQAGVVTLPVDASLPATLRIDSVDGSRIEYAFDEHGGVRTQTIPAGERRDLFPLPGAKFTFTREGILVRCLIERSGAVAAGEPHQVVNKADRTVEILAIVGPQTGSTASVTEPVR